MTDNRLYFNTLSAALLYEWELSGQISDGKYENSRPSDHWRWVCDAVVYVDKDVKNHTDRWIRKKYNLNEWSGYMKDGQNGWAWRCANYVRFGACFEDTQENYNLITSKVSRTSVECLKDKYDSYEDFLKDYENWPSWARSESFLEVFTEDVYNKYYSQEISVKEFNKYHKLMKETVNRSEEDAIQDEEKAVAKAAAKEAEKEAKKAAKLAEAAAKRKELIENTKAKHTEITEATTEDDLIAPQNGVSSLEVKLEALKYIKERFGITPKELCVKL